MLLKHTSGIFPMCEALANLRLLVDLELDVSGNGIGQAIECQLMNLPLSNCFQNMYYSHTYTTHTDTHTHMQLHQCSGVWIFFLQFKGDSGACELARAMSSLSKLCRFCEVGLIASCDVSLQQRGSSTNNHRVFNMG